MCFDGKFNSVRKATFGWTQHRLRNINGPNLKQDRASWNKRDKKVLLMSNVSSKRDYKSFEARKTEGSRDFFDHGHEDGLIPEDIP